MNLITLLKRNDFTSSRVLLCFFTCLSVFYSSSVMSAISTVASEQSGTIATGNVGHVGAGTFATRNNCGNITPSIPAGNVGDILIAVALVREQNATVTMDANWTQYYTENFGAGGNETEGYIFYRIATNDALDTNTMTSAGAGNCRSLVGQISRFSGVDTSSPFETDPIVAGNSSTQNTNTVSTGTETTTTANALSIAVTYISDNATVATADSFTESFDSTSTVSRDSGISLSYRQETVAGAKGPFTWSQTLGTDESIGVLFALTPDPTNEAVTVNVPTGTTTDDVMLAAIAVGPSSIGISAPAGWTLINRQDQGTATSNSQALYYRVATVSEPASYTWTFSGVAINGTAAGIITYRGVDTSSVIDISGSQATASSTSHASPSVVTTIANAMVVTAHSYSSSASWTTAPTGMTEQVDIASSGTLVDDGISLGMFDVLQATAGATGIKTAIAASNGDTGAVQIVALTPTTISSGITVTFAGGPIQRILAGSISVTDAALGAPEASATNFNVANSAAITTNISTIANNALLIDVVGKARGNHTYTPGAGQTERWDNELGNNNNGATGAMSTKDVATAGATSMVQTHTSATRRNAHAVVSIAPVDSSSTATFDAVASATGNNGNSINWTHTFATSTTVNTKLVVGVTYREPAACGLASISGITFGSLTLTQIAATSVFDGGRCQYSELWYVDLNNIIVSTDNNSNLGGQAIDQDEAVEYDIIADTGTLFFDDATFDSNARLDALHLLDNGNIAISVAGNGEAIGGNAIPNGSIALVSPSGTTGVYNFSSILFAETNFVSNDETIDAVYVRDNGNVVLSTAGNANLAGLGVFDDDDIVEWDGASASLVFNIASIAGAAANWDVDGVHFLNDDPMLILFSLYNDRTIGPTTYENGDVLLYDRNTSTLSIYFSEDNFTANEDVDALTLAVDIIATPTLQNFVVTVSATASTCTSTEITIEARDTTNTIFNYDGTITLSTSTNNGNWDEVDHLSMISATNPATNLVVDATADDGAATYLFDVADTGRVGLFLSNDHAETLAVTVEDTTVAGSATISGNIVFSDNVFEITPTTCTGSSCPGTGSLEVVAGRNHTFQVEMIRNDGTSCGVAAGYNSNPQTLKGWIVRDGVDDPGGVLPTLAEETAALGDPAIPGADNISLDFSAGGTATLTLQTTDVGEFELFLRDDTLGFAGVNINGSTGSADNITIRPFGIAFTNINVGGSANPGASSPGGANIFTSAGTDFEAEVGAYLWNTTDDVGNDGIPDGASDITNNGLTPAYDWATTISIVADNPTAAQITAESGQLGTFNNGSIAAGAFSSGLPNGRATVSNLQYLEVGSITMNLEALDFLNDTNVDLTLANGTAINSGVVGAFRADHFEFTVDTAPAFGAACNNFTYVDQLFSFNNTPLITARAVSTVATGSSTLLNYHDFAGAGGINWWRLNFDTGVSPVYTDGTAPAQISLVDTSDYMPNTGSTSTTNGTRQFTLSGSFEYDDRGTVPYGPIVPFNSAMQLAFTVTDSDTASGTETINPITFADPEQRWGRFLIGTASGSELLAISPQFEAQYFDATSNFVPNNDDTCTTVTAAGLILTNNVGTQAGGTIDINDLTGACAGTSIATGVVTSPPSSWGLSFSVAAPQAACTGYIDIDIDLSASDWLQYDWSDLDDADDGPYGENPSGRVDFGIYEGPNSFIYIREPW